MMNPDTIQAIRQGRRIGPGIAVVLVGLWLAAVVLAMNALMGAERSPGREATAPETWPAGSELPAPAGRATLVVAAHPRCPCTRATLDQLIRIVSRAPGAVTGHVLFYRPSGTEGSWARTSLWNRVGEIPGFTAVEDVDGRRAKAFGAATSGHVFLYDGAGVLRFAGGVTSGRGTVGESSGMNSILTFLQTGRCPFPQTPVFGCPIFEPPFNER